MAQRFQYDKGAYFIEESVKLQALLCYFTCIEVSGGGVAPTRLFPLSSLTIPVIDRLKNTHQKSFQQRR
ncbi:hypothetical protein HMPREF1553_00808 [Porphyromonas gingivalis F0568]|nr:hypothetical protein HMPREF1553_00808 [Porphyromonas gingivalis F0568]